MDTLAPARTHANMIALPVFRFMSQPLCTTPALQATSAMVGFFDIAGNDCQFQESGACTLPVLSCTWP